MRQSLVLAICALSLTSPARALASFAYRKAITFNGGGSGVIGGPHANFPVLVSLVDGNLQTGVTSPNGYDIVFRGEDAATCGGPATCMLAHEIERWDGATGTLRAWVRVPSLGAGTVIYVYYGDAQITASTATPAAVFDTDYVGVWHLAESGSGIYNEFRDSSAYQNHGRGGQGTALAVPTQVGGQIGFGQRFDNADGTWNFIDTGDDGTMNISGNQITLEAWVRQSVIPSGKTRGILNHKGYYDGYSLWMQEDGFQCAPSPALCLTFNLPGQTHALKSASALGSGSWHHVVATYDGTTMRIYIDGVADANTRAKTGNISPSIAEPWMFIGQGDLPAAKPWSAEWEGELDEVRISRVARSANWIQTGFNNQSLPGSFYAVGGQDTAGAPYSLTTPTVNYRSIGSAGNYSGTLAAVNGSPLVNDATATWKTANRGRGDRITINGVDYTVLFVNSETQIRLTAPYAGAGGSYAYTIARKFGSPVTWENCIDGPGGAGCEGVSSSSLVADNRSEVGILYYDGSVYGGMLTTIDGSTTDAAHTITLTVDAGNRHPGRSAASPAWVALFNTGGNPLFRVNDGNVTLEWLDLFGGAIGGPHGIEVSSVVPAGPVVIRNNVIHDNGTDGITIADASAVVDIYDNVIYETAYGVHFTVDMSPSGRANLYNNTIYSSNSGTGPSGIKSDVRQTTLRVDLRNNIVHSNTGGDIGLSPWFDRAYFCDAVPTCTQIGNGGVLGATEYLADPALNYALNFAGAGHCLYFGSANRFRGLVANLTAGSNPGAANLTWSYWNGAWTNLRTISACPAGTNCPFYDGTDRFQYTSTLYWPDDPPAWATTTVSGSPALFYVRACSSAAYTTPATERLMSRLDVSVAGRSNLTSDSTATPHSLFNTQFTGVDGVSLPGVNFISTTAGSEDLHLQTGSAAVDTAFNLSARFVNDIDAALRVAPWDIGADDLSATTEVALASFTATALDSAVDLEWTTASELRNLGFHLHRSESEDGPFTRITPSVIPGLGSSPTGATYSWRDSGLSNGMTYFYRLEDIETTGKTALHGPLSATPKAGSGIGDGDGAGEEEDGSAGGGVGRITYGDPGASTLRVLERGPAHVVLELVTPGFQAVTEEGGTVRVSIPGFEETGSPGSLAVPVRQAFVDALAGRKVALTSVSASEVVSFDSFRLSAAPAREAVLTESGMVETSSSHRSLRDTRGGLTPRLWAHLLGTVFQGEAKKARLELAPLRHDPRSGRTVLARRLVVRLDFVGKEAGEQSLGGSRGRRRPVDRPLNRGGVVAELVVKEAGLYRVRFEDVFGAARRGVDARNLGLSRLGRAVAYHLVPDRPLFGPGSSLFFLTEGETLNPQGDAVYELRLGQAASRMNVASGAPLGPPTTEYLETLRQERDQFYQAALLEAPDSWLWDLLVSPTTKSYSFEVDRLSSSSTSSSLRVVLQGASDFEEPDHHLRFALNGIPMGEASWDGKREHVFEAQVPAGVLVEGTNTLTLENVGDAGAAYSMVFLNRFALTYPRRLATSHGRLEGRFEQSGRTEIEGLSGPGFVVDAASPPVWLQDTAPATSGLAFSAEAGHRYLAVSEASLLSPEVRRRLPSRLRSSAHRADWILLAPREFLPAAAPLLELRRSQGLNPEAVAVEDVYSEFGFGEKSAAALHDFLSFAFHNWKTTPRYVLLLGDSTYDPKDHLGTGALDRLPTPIVATAYLLTASDPALAAVNGEDLVPDLAIGRLSAGSLEEAHRLVQKLVAFEQAGRTFDGKAVLVADNGDRAGAFEADQDEIAATVLPTREVQKLYLRDLGGALRPALRDALDSGPALVSYVGHGATAVWASENVWNNTDLALLAGQPQQPLLMTWNCLNGFFHFPPLDSLAEAFVKAEGKGAIAAFAPSGLSSNQAAHVYQKAFLRELESGSHQRLGDAVLAAQRAYADSGALPELLLIYHLFGDPALRLR